MLSLHPVDPVVPPVERPRRFIRLRNDFDLLNPAYVQAAAHDLRLLRKSRREVPDWIADRLYEFNGDILTSDYKPLRLRDGTIDAAFGYVDDGGDSMNWGADFRWVSDFLKFAGRPPRQRAHERLKKRLTLIHLALAIEFMVVNPSRRAETMLFADEVKSVVIGRSGRLEHRIGDEGFGSRLIAAVKHGFASLTRKVRSRLGWQARKPKRGFRRYGSKKRPH